jgi:regulator of nucleoside diphosphate kinase
MNIYLIGEGDRERLDALLRGYRPFLHTELQQMMLLRRRLDMAVILPEERLVPEVVSLYSQVELQDLNDRTTRRYELVLPHEVDAAHGRVSVLSPLGGAMLGLREGNVFECSVPEGVFTFAVRSVEHKRGMSASVNSNDEPTVRTNQRRRS